jgi:hypothetical protein
MGTQAVIPPKMMAQMCERFDSLIKAKEVITLGLSRKECAFVQRKAQRQIVYNARKLTITRKNNGLKLFFVTCDSFRKPKPPHRNIWVNMLHGYCSCLDPSINNINKVFFRLTKKWEYVGYDLSYREFNHK